MEILRDLIFGIGLLLAFPFHLFARFLSIFWWPLKNVKGEIAVITGGGSGIGKGMAQKLAELGAVIIIWDVNETAAKKAAKEIENKFGKGSAFAYGIDITDRKKVYTLADKVKKEVGHVTMLINNAGIVTGKPFLEAEDERMIKTMEVNTISHFWTTKAFLPDMIERNHGHLVTVASSAGKVGVPGLSDYCASKFAAVGFDESIRFELRKLGKNGVHTTCVCPYFIDTGMFEGAKTKYPIFLPILKPELVVDRVIRGIRTNQALVAIPRFLYFAQVLQGIFPPSIADPFVELMGARDWFAMQQTTDTVLMVRPARFGFNNETADSNAFQINDKSVSADDIQVAAIKEFNDFVQALRSNGINVIEVDDKPEPYTPDAVFPNNWVTFHHDGKVVTFPMLSERRRFERRDDILSLIASKFSIRERVCLEQHEHNNRFLEGTGSVVLDHNYKRLYACRSPRTHEELVNEFARIVGYSTVLFNATNASGQEIYHTNVMMAIGDKFVIVCLDAVRDDDEKKMLKREFERTNKKIICISIEQMNNFAGNMLQVRNTANQSLLVMSQKARSVLNHDQLTQIEQYATILAAPLDTIEKYGGGSARCMLAEIFSPKP